MSGMDETVKSFLKIMEDDELDFIEANGINADTEDRYIRFRLEGKTPVEALGMIQLPAPPDNPEPTDPAGAK